MSVKNVVIETIEKNCVNLEVEKLENDFESIKEKMSVFKTMKTGDKLMKFTDCSDNTSYYVVSSDDWQRTKRWWAGEDRSKTIDYLDEEFKFFTHFLDNVLFNMKEHNLLKYFTLALEVSRFINDILPGLYSLKETYVNYEEMTLKVDSIITTLIDYKDQVEIYKKENRNRRQLPSNMLIKRTKSK
jgi:hypothetical protein